MKIPTLQLKENLKIAGPVAVSQLGHMAVAVADTVMAGSLGALPLAAATLALSVFIPFLMIAIGITYGITPIVAKADGEGDTVTITKLLKNSIYLSCFSSLALFLFLLLGVETLQYMNNDTALITLAKPFFLIQSISLIPLIFFLVLKQFAEGLSITRPATAITIAANIINVVLIYIFIHGYSIFPNLGFNGIAYATLIARIFMLVAMIVYFLINKKFGIYRKMYHQVKGEWKEILALTKSSLPIGIQLMLESGAFGFAAIMAGWIGAKEIAAHQISLNIAAITYMAATGIASAATVRVGFELGKKNLEGMKAAGWAAFLLILLYESITCLFFIVFRHELPKLYIDDNDILILSASLLLITALFQLSDGIQVVAMGALRGLGDVQIPTLVAVFSYWIIGLPTGYVLAFYWDFGVQGIWYGLLIGLSISAVLLSYRFNKKLLEAKFD